jgi:hypothetical protein
MDVPDERDVSVLDVPNLLDKANHLIELSAGEAPLPSIRQKLDEAGYLLEQADLELQTWAGN